MPCASLGAGPQLGPQCLFGDRVDRVDRAAEDVFEVELQAELATRIGRTIECHESIGVVVCACLIAGS